MATGIDLIISTICNTTLCTIVQDNPFLVNQITEQKAYYDTLAQELNGKHLKIGTLYNYPISWATKSQNGSTIGHGVTFVIVNILREKFNFTFEIVTPEKNFEAGGNKNDDSLIGLVNSSAVDFAAALVPLIPKYLPMIDYSTELDEGVWMMMLRRPNESATGSGLLAPFKINVWYLVLAAVIFYGPCITLLTQMRARLVRDKEHYISLSPSFWFVYGAFIKQGTTLAPEANTTRVLFATWWLFIILLSAFYTANLTAFLTLSKFTLDIENPQDLYKKNYRWVAAKGGAVEFTVTNPLEDLYYLNSMVVNGRAEFRSTFSDEEFLPMVSGGAVLVKEQVSIDHMMYGDYLRKAREGVAESDRCTYVVAPNAFMKKLRAFVYPRNSTLKILFDPVLRRLIQAGIIDYLQTRDLPSTKICPLDLQSKDRQLRNSDLLMTYLIMVTGLAAASATFIGEVVLKRYFRVKYRTETTKNRPKKKRVKISKPKKVIDTSRPPPYESLFNSDYKFNENSKKKIINGTEYWEVETIYGDTRLIPVRTPSAFLYH